MAKKLPIGEFDWRSPARVFCSDRSGGVSSGPWSSNNLGHHVDDAVDAVARNRARLLELPGVSSVQWLTQVHGTDVVQVQASSGDMPRVDGMWTDQPGTALAILTADCLPVMVADIAGRVVGAAHAGWRGLCAGVLPELIDAMPVPADRLDAFIGPAIGKAAFEVGGEVVDALAGCGLADWASEIPGQVHKFQVDLAGACRTQLAGLGVNHIEGGLWCTYHDERFYSFRRETHRLADLGRGTEPAVTGRQATLVWLPSC